MKSTSTFVLIAACLVVVLVLSFSPVTTHVTQKSNIVNQTSLTNQNGNITSSILYKPLQNGDYRVSVYQLNTQSAISASLSTNILWTDNGASLNQKPASDIAFSSTNSFSDGSIYFHAQANQTISFSSNLLVSNGSPKYSLEITVEQLK